MSPLKLIARFFVGFLMVTGAAALAADAPVPVAGFQGTGPLLGQAPAIAPPPYRVRWQVRAGGENERATIEGSPTIAGNTVYVADGNGILHALDLGTGREHWTYKSEGGFATTPLVLESRVMLGDLDGIFHCIAADSGKKVWTFDSGSSIHASANLTPDRKAILFGNDGAQVFALSVGDGKQIWEGKGGDRINACPAIGFGSALFTGCDARLLALNLADGKETFAAELGGLAPGSPVVLDDRIIAGTGEGNVVALSPDGKQTLWKYAQVDQEGAMFYASPAYANGIVVIGCRDRSVHAINARDGTRKWAFKTRGEVDAAPVISDGRVYAPSKDKKLYVLDLATGKKLWEFQAGRGIEAGVAIGGGAIILADTSGNIYCLEEKKE